MNDRLKEVRSWQQKPSTIPCDWMMMTTVTVSSQAENRAEFAERTVAKLEKTIDDLEGTVVISLFKCVLPLTSLFSSESSVSVLSFPS